VSRNSRRARTKSASTIATIGYLFDGHVRPSIGKLRVDRTGTARVERAFRKMADAGYATSTIGHTWTYLNQACLDALRLGTIRTNPATDVLLPEARPARTRKSFTIDEVVTLLRVAIPNDRRPALWVTGLMCGLRPGELVGLRWPDVDIDSAEPAITVAKRVSEIGGRYLGQAEPKTPRKGAIGLHAPFERHRTTRSYGPRASRSATRCSRTTASDTRAAWSRIVRAAANAMPSYELVSKPPQRRHRVAGRLDQLTCQPARPYGHGGRGPARGTPGRPSDA
jgi:integrase